MDLVQQRLLIAALEKQPCPYSPDELITIAHHCTEREDAANKLERKVIKMLLAKVMMPEVGSSFDASISGCTRSSKQVWVRILRGPYAGVEGRLWSEDFDTCKVGVDVRVRLRKVDPKKGYIDFDLEQQGPTQHKKTN